MALVGDSQLEGLYRSPKIWQYFIVVLTGINPREDVLP